MNLELDLDNDSEFEQSLEKGTGGGFTKTDDLEWVESGLYKCFIASAILVHRSNGDAISCTFVALDNEGVEPVGKFTTSYSVEPSDKFFGKTKELCFLTGNGNGLIETEIKNKDGETVCDSQGNPMYKYDGLCANEFQLIATVLRKAGDYEAPNGKKRHNRLWNGGNGRGRVWLYRDGRLIDRTAVVDGYPSGMILDGAIYREKSLTLCRYQELVT